MTVISKQFYNKKTLLIILIFIFIALIMSYIVFHKKSQTNLREGQAKNQSQELILSEKELKQYYKVYSDPYVLHIRKSLDNYLRGKNEGISPVAIESLIDDDKKLSGLDSFDKSYYTSKFNVFAVNDSIGGGKTVNIIFLDKPDKLFNVWIYKLASGEYELRGFWQNESFGEKEMENIQRDYRQYLKDKEHSL